MPWLMDSVEAQLTLVTISRHMLDAVIHDAVCTRAQQHSQLAAAEVIAAQPYEPEQSEPVVEMTMASDNEDEQQVSSSVT